MTNDYKLMDREELMEEVRKRDTISIKGQPGIPRLIELLEEDDGKAEDFVPAPPPFVSKDNALGMDDLADQFDESGIGMDQFRERAKNPFTGYPVRLVKARFYPRNPIMDRMSKEDLIQFCIRNLLFHKDWVVQRGFDVKGKDQHEMILNVDVPNGWDADKIREYIDRRQTHTFPSHHLVFTRHRPTKPGVPHAIALKSWFTKRPAMIWFNLAWPLPTPENPYEQGEPMRCQLVDDDSVRAQLFFVRQRVTGKVISRKIGQDSKSDSYFLLKDDQARSAPLLERIFRAGTRGSATMKDWEKTGGLPELQ